MPVAVPAAVLAHARVTAAEVAARAGIDVDAEELICGRAALLGLTGHGRVSAGGATRLLAARDGWCALTLSRPDDVDAVPALVESDDVPPDPWAAVEHRVRETGVSAFAERARLLGLPVGVLGETAAAAPRVRRLGPRRDGGGAAGLLVADLSSMWAGPLCAMLLARAGAIVVKVETAARPDGTRAGPAAFFDWVNAGKLSYRADLGRPAALRRLLAAADVVIESSRPAALARRGLGPSDLPARNGRVWVRITGHGAVGDRADWVAFGDDAAVSGGLVAGTTDAPVFCADAIADPLTGLLAAHATLAALYRGGGELIDVAMSETAAGYARLSRGDERCCAARPSTPAPAAELGADNATVDALVARRDATTC
ncbi:CoA transferase [Mycobacterium sp. Y57]|uniref:CoA transferase n=1 Tax=Mycolicibacterium xanthum TaxID=2796469 RepID=UPI001C856543|nr:CoA transferase [Mycolicibacterium xanthum]MBX7431728.1 CoA transferase [Mycolicibacterium xanthum]